MYRYTTPGFIQRIDPFLTWKMKKAEKPTLYLTFDDGPHPEITPWVLAILAEFKAKATFFCVGANVEKYPEVYRRILHEGHAVGNHTFHHLKGWEVSNEDYFNDIDACAQLVDSKLFRPPYGKITPSQALKLRRDGYKIIMWSVLSRDFEPELNQEESVNAVRQNSDNGSILVYHDSLKAEKNLREMLPQVLAHFRKQQFEFTAL